MNIPPKYELTKNVSSLLSQFEANRAVIDALSIPVAIEENFRRASFLGSSLFSARIEGNTLTESDVSDFRDLTSKEKERVEVANLSRALKYILERYDGTKEVTPREILTWHQMAMENILDSEYLGAFRKGHEGIFDQAGNLIYHAPPPSQVESLILKLTDYANNTKEEIAPIGAILAHLLFEKIHPFVDGSGRVGRLLQYAILANNGYAMKGMVVVEKEIDDKRQLYYHAIENPDATEFLELMLELLVVASQKAKEKVQASQKFQKEDLLAPRRREILEIIRDHQIVSFDTLHRRFFSISPRLLAYDLKYLMDNGYISKIGKTRGAQYTISVS